jgi:hypothetical protein
MGLLLQKLSTAIYWAVVKGLEHLRLQKHYSLLFERCGMLECHMNDGYHSSTWESRVVIVVSSHFILKDSYLFRFLLNMCLLFFLGSGFILVQNLVFKKSLGYTVYYRSMTQYFSGPVLSL